MSNFIISPYNFVVAVDLCQLLSYDYKMPMYEGTNQRVGVKLQAGSTWIGQTITGAKFWLQGDGGSALCYGRVYRDGTTDPIITFGSVDISTIDTENWEEITFSGGSYTLLENDIVCVENPNSSGSAKLYSDPYFDGEPNNLVQMRYGASWVLKAGESLKMCIE